MRTSRPLWMVVAGTCFGNDRRTAVMTLAGGDVGFDETQESGRVYVKVAMVGTKPGGQD